MSYPLSHEVPVTLAVYVLRFPFNIFSGADILLPQGRDHQ